MGSCLSGNEREVDHLPPQQKRPEVERIDQVKFKLKKARDTIKNFVNAKNKDLSQVESQIQ